MPEAPPAALPGADLVALGLRDLARGEITVPALLVARAATRLRAAGVPVPVELPPDPDLALYRRLSTLQGDAAHARYNALSRRLVSYCVARERAAGG